MRLYTRKEAAQLMKIGLRTLDRRIASGEIQCYRLGDGPRAPVRISQVQLEAYLTNMLISDRGAVRREATRIRSRV